MVWQWPTSSSDGGDKESFSAQGFVSAREISRPQKNPLREANCVEAARARRRMDIAFNVHAMVSERSQASRAIARSARPLQKRHPSSDRWNFGRPPDKRLPASPKSSPRRVCPSRAGNLPTPSVCPDIRIVSSASSRVRVAAVPSRPRSRSASCAARRSSSARASICIPARIATPAWSGYLMLLMIGATAFLPQGRDMSELLARHGFGGLLDLGILGIGGHIGPECEARSSLRTAMASAR